jgi:putative Mg2+ transporter-C (MgtC) family protein
VALSGVVGLERELKGKPAGLRTNILIGLGATMFTRLSLQFGSGDGDPGRIAAQILTGIGFIGAGTILHNRGAVTGLTSAATIWVVTAIGMAVGSAQYVEAIGSTVMAVLVLAGVGFAERRLEGRLATRRYVVHAAPDPAAVSGIESVAAAVGAEIERTHAREQGSDLVVEVHLRGTHRALEQFLVAIVQRPGIKGVRGAE